MNKNLIERIQEELRKELPGQAYQFKMAPANRRLLFNRKISEGTRQSSVLIPLFEDGGTLCTVLFKRPEYDGIHAGQVCFTGGKYEPGDPNLMVTALREAKEELGIEESSVNVLGSLSPLHIPVSDYLVFPWIGYIARKPEFIPDKNEVDTVIMASLNNLMDTNKVKTDVFQRQGYEIETPYYLIDGHIIWGATAMIISEFTEVLRRAGC